jgi:type IV secretion system protein VirB10
MPTVQQQAMAPAPEAGSRVTASRLANPSLTVPQGAIIAAVLETALDSTRPGAARAIVSRDVRSFDGSRVLVPRGSRLYGEYAADVSSGQNRALITWSRLTRPDAVIINLDSPSADPLGRAGVRGKVDSHFFARFGSAILQSVLDIGVGLATRSTSDNAVIVALPGSSQQVTASQPTQVQPTLRIQQGTSVSVFVSRDLDFSTVE